MKKTSMVALGLVGSLALTGGCGSGGEASSGNSANIELVLGRLGDPFTAQIACGAEEEAKKLGYKVSVSGPGVWSASDQMPFLNAAIAKNPNALLVEATDTKALNAPLKTYADSGKPLITVDSGIDQDFTFAAIGSNNYNGGKQAAEAYAKAVGGKGQVLIVNVAPGIGVTDERQKGFEDALKNYPDIKYLGTEFAGDDAGKVAEIIHAKKAANRDLNGIFATATLVGEAAGSVVSTDNLKDIYLVAFDASPKEAELVQAGNIDALIVQKPRLMGQLGVQAAAAALKGETFTAESETGYAEITPENISDPDNQALLYSTEC
ncbi:ABC transporter substrate-binding protein [Acrocarpospora catenulata]|uniref:ABC transporter substrate-binding protein n=1 Tax=Acrocarpospora catenulata TaxID=2836182 RepID=UPI001BDA108B|nr:ABC transporter substrate-binding protein [Acrocarpospora catenulata]